MKDVLKYILVGGLMVISLGAEAVAFDPNVRYSKEVIDSRMTSWNNKTNPVGFPNANSTNGRTTPTTEATWDYVPGVVAKGILDCWDFYQNETWADAWYQGLSSWALSKEAKNTGGSLDDLNCTKVFMKLYDGAKSGGKFENASNATYFMTQMQRGAIGLAAHKSSYSEGGTTGMAGGWYHKSSYPHQMWCDGAYMGPALLAQLIEYDALGSTGLTWDDVVLQFTASWPYLWDDTEKLLYHVVTTNTSYDNNSQWAQNHGTQVGTSGVYHSEEFWGRADGWYIVALVDVLEAMHNAGYDTENPTNYNTLKGYLNQLAAGLVARQDATTGCWYQLLQYDNSKTATKVNDDVSVTGSTTYRNSSTQANYLESSGSCLITAALLKGERLGLYTTSYAAAAKKGFEGIVNQFVKGTEGNYTISTSCESAGLGSDRNGTAAYYLIGKDVTINNNTEGKVFGPFLMAAVEYERAYLPAPAGCNCLNVEVR